MVASGRSVSSSSSFHSPSSLGVSASSLGQVPSPAYSTLTWPNTGGSALTTQPSFPPVPLQPPDLGPPGYHATIKLFESTPNETTVYLGPWEIIGSDPRRVVWQCSYEGEVLEHFLPTENPSGVFPFTFHAHHRRFGDPQEMELYLTFKESHRLRYLTPDGVVFDDFVDVGYEFTTMESSIQFQGDLRKKDLIDWFDLDVAWTDVNRRTDKYGNVHGLGTIQRLKLWRDRYSPQYFLTLYATHQRRWREFPVQDFEPEIRSQDTRHKRVQLGARIARRASGAESKGREGRFSASGIFCSRNSSSSSSSPSSSTSSGPNSSGATTSLLPPRSSLDFRYLSLQFSQTIRVQPVSENMSRFLDRWHFVHSIKADSGVPYPPNYAELPSPHNDTLLTKPKSAESKTTQTEH